jgi:peptide deformylase
MSKKIKFIDGEMVEYEVLPLVDQYDPILRKPTTPVNFEEMTGHKISYVAMSLMESLSKYEGLGLSANQVGLSHRVCAINMLSEKKIWCLINPRITEKSKTLSTYKEGCLSFPGLYIEVGRPSWVDVEFYAANGTRLNHKFHGIEATCVQHELDHLDGVVFTDLISPIKLDMAKRKVKANLRKIKHATIA